MRDLVIALALAAIAAPTMAAEPAKPAAKPAAKAPAAKPFDARDPASLIDLLSTMDAKGQVMLTEKGMVVVDITTPGGKFGAQFVQCDDKGKACGAVAFSTSFERRGPTLSQVNIFNRTQVACRGYLTEDGKANVMYAAMLTARMPAAEMKQHLGVWQGCLGTFGQFNRDPQAYISEGPR